MQYNYDIKNTDSLAVFDNSEFLKPRSAFDVNSGALLYTYKHREAVDSPNCRKMDVKQILCGNIKQNHIVRKKSGSAYPATSDWYKYGFDPKISRLPWIGLYLSQEGPRKGM